MSDEFSYQSQISLRNGSLLDSYSTQSLRANQSVALLVRNVQPVSNVSHAALGLGSVVTPGWAVFTNLDATNYIEVGIDVGAVFYPFIKLLPGETSGPVRLGMAAPYALANTATVSLFYIIYND